ncbi:MAG: DNA polymerase III subunit gamma/tau, partial [Oscillospiraceae bacterium]
MYLALYRKWRPKTFADVIGQEHITTTLKNEIEQNRLAHSYLFTGPRGTGKTTCSKILSMAVNCDNPINGNPCMVCENCKGIENGSVLDVVEIDAASNNGVDNIRDLRDEASYTPSQCKYRVYIIDEAHMLSTGAFNALLKIMEEPPPHVIFILATTEAHKVPATILSRCQRFDFHRIKSDCISKRLLYISNEEKAFTLNQDAADLIARLSDGGMRDALSLLDQCVASCPITSQDEQVIVTLDTVTESAGVVTQDYLFNMANFIFNGEASSAVTLIDELYAMSKDLQSLANELVLYFRNIMLTQTLKNPADLVLVLPNELERITVLATKFLPSQILYYITQLQDCMSQMAKNVDRRLSFELCLVRLCTPSLSTSNDALLARIDMLESKLRSGNFQTTNAP